MADNIFNFNIYEKPSNSFSYLNHNSCHPTRTKNNSSLSLAKGIVRIISGAIYERLNKLMLQSYTNCNENILKI